MTGDPATRPTRDGALCGASTRTGGTCRNIAGFRTDHPHSGHCYLHGGSSPSGRRMAQREVAYATARSLGVPADVDPADGLLALVRETAGLVAWLREQAAALAPDDLIRGTRYVRRTEGPDGPVTVTEAGPGEHLWSVMYARERRNFADVCAKALAAGVAQRQVQLAEEQGELAGRLVRAILTDLGHDLNDPGTRDVIRRHLTLVRGQEG